MSQWRVRLTPRIIVVTIAGLIVLGVLSLAGSRALTTTPAPATANAKPAPPPEPPPASRPGPADPPPPPRPRAPSRLRPRGSLCARDGADSRRRAARPHARKPRPDPL